jgi:hypothetical protein
VDAPPRPVARGWVPASSATGKGVKASTGELPAASPPESGAEEGGRHSRNRVAVRNLPSPQSHERGGVTMPCS